MKLLSRLDAAGVIPRGQIVAATVFTTQSVTATLEKIRDQIKAATPQAADFNLGPGGTRTVFPLSGVTMMLCEAHQQHERRYGQDDSGHLKVVQ